MKIDFGLDIRHLKDKNGEQIVTVKDCFNNKAVFRKDNPLYHMLGGFTKDGHQNAERVLAIADECYCCEISNYKKDFMLSQYFYGHDNIILTSLQNFNGTQIIRDANEELRDDFYCTCNSTCEYSEICEPITISPGAFIHVQRVNRNDNSRLKAKIRTEYSYGSEYLFASIIDTDQIAANNDIIISSDATEIIFKV